MAKKSERQQIIDRVKALTGSTPDEATIQYVTEHGGPSSVKEESTGGGGLGAFLDYEKNFFTQPETRLQDVEHYLKPVGHALEEGVTGKAPAAAKSKSKKKPASTSQQDALQKLAQWLTSNYQEQGQLAMAQQGQALAQQNQAITNTIGQYLGGNGVSSGNPAVDAAMGAYQKAYSAGEGAESAAYANMGAANAQYLGESPLYPVANLLTQGFGSTQFKELPQSVVSALPESVQYALAQAGVGETTGNTGTPDYGQAIAAPKGGWPKALTGSGANSASSLASILGNIGANSSTNNAVVSGALTPGNPSIASS